MTVTQASIDTFARDGAVVLRGVFAEWVAALREGLDEVMADPSPLERSYQVPGSAPFFQDLCNWRRSPGFEDFVRHSPAAPLAAALMGSRTARFFHDHVLVPLDPIPRDICMECIAGSHTWQRLHKPKRFDGSAGGEPDPDSIWLGPKFLLVACYQEGQNGDFASLAQRTWTSHRSPHPRTANPRWDSRPQSGDWDGRQIVGAAAVS